ncbi:hypothetical protein EJ08DRAFT_584098, partial [Tothia fuscella]
GAFFIVVALINAAIEFYQQQKSAALLSTFLLMNPLRCKCIRDGRLSRLEVDSLVPGDIVHITRGDKVPADLFLFSISDCKVDNSSLTGESEPQERTIPNKMQNPLEASNLAFNSTVVLCGEAYGIVIRTGDKTLFGQIASLTAGQKPRTSSLTHEINNFVKLIATIAILTALVFFGIGFRRNQNNVSLALNFAIGVFIAWVPEGLPATITLLLTIAAKRLAKENVLVKDLQAVETLGAITMLATDKTGTLTQSQMTVTNIWTCGKLLYASNNFSSENEEKVAAPDDPGMRNMLVSTALCSRSIFNRTDGPLKERGLTGDGTECGLTRYVTVHLHDYDEVVRCHSKVFELPFNSETKWYMSIHQMPHMDGSLTLLMKGAPERVFKFCTHILIGNNTQISALTEEHKVSFEEAHETLAGRGHRVLGFATLMLPESKYPKDFKFDRVSQNYPLSGLVFLGLVSLVDPPKQGVREAIGACRSAGIKVLMVTGDHPSTARAIAGNINLMLSDTNVMVAKGKERPTDSTANDQCNAIIVHGDKIDDLTDAEWDSIFWKDEIIFARTSPKHKLEIVRRAQSMGHIVGFVGDGVNDAPALRKADLGIAMQISGSDVSKEAASMIILNDHFESLVRGIAEGRLIFANLKKSIQYTLSHCTPQIIPNLLFVLVPIPLPLPAILILVIDLGFELIAALSFAWDPPEGGDDLMKVQPRKPVTPETCEIFRRRALRKTRSHFDEEKGMVVAPENETKFQKYWYRVRLVFNKQWWADIFESTGAEVLIDWSLLSWAYLEIGVLETLGALISFFFVLWRRGIYPQDTPIMQKGSGPPTHYWSKKATPYKGIDGLSQARDLLEAQSIYFWSIVAMQMFNLFACKRRRHIPFGRYMFANWVTFLSAIVGGGLAVIIIYVPKMGVVFKTTQSLWAPYLLMPIAFGLVIIAYASLRVLVVRRSWPVKWQADIPGLQLQRGPTS